MAAPSAARSNGRRSTSWAPVRIARSRRSESSWSVVRNSEPSGCSRRYCAAAVSVSSWPRRSSSSTRMSGRTWRASASPPRRSGRSPAIWIGPADSNAERSTARSFASRCTRTTDSAWLTVCSSGVGDEPDTERHDAAARTLAAAGAGDDLVEEFAVELALGSGAGAVAQEERGEAENGHARLPVDRRGDRDQHHARAAAAAGEVGRVADVLVTHRIGVETRVNGLARRSRHVPGLGVEDLALLDRAAVAVGHQATERVGAGRRHAGTRATVEALREVERPVLAAAAPGVLFLSTTL